VLKIDQNKESMSFEVAGKLHKKFDTENKTDTFQAREFVIVVEGNYPQFVKFQLVQDRCSLVDNFEEGEMITVHFDLRGREWNGKYFTNLNAWRVEKHEPATPNADASGSAPLGDSSFPSANDEPATAADDDLPF
jgi:single-strand DNA-binding protein